jgi:hypothetical protein
LPPSEKARSPPPDPDVCLPPSLCVSVFSRCSTFSINASCYINAACRWSTRSRSSLPWASPCSDMTKGMPFLFIRASFSLSAALKGVPADAPCLFCRSSVMGGLITEEQFLATFPETNDPSVQGQCFTSPKKLELARDRSGLIPLPMILPTRLQVSLFRSMRSAACSGQSSTSSTATSLVESAPCAKTSLLLVVLNLEARLSRRFWSRLILDYLVSSPSSTDSADSLTFAMFLALWACSS